MDDFENDDKIVLHIIAGKSPAVVPSASNTTILHTEASPSAAQMPRPARLHDDLNDLQVLNFLRTLACSRTHAFF